MKYVSKFWSHIKHFKYPIILTVGFVYVGLLDANSWLVRYHNAERQAKLEEEIDIYNKMNDENLRILKAIEHDPQAMKDIAREKYFMKEADEDIFVLSDDK